jgi:hypothetical protein
MVREDGGQIKAVLRSLPQAVGTWIGPSPTRWSGAACMAWYSPRTAKSNARPQVVEMMKARNGCTGLILVPAGGSAGRMEI